MNSSFPFLLIAIVTMVTLAVVIFYKKQEQKFTPLASLAFTFVLSGIMFSSNRFVCYGLLFVGVSLAIADILNKSKANQ